MSRRAFRISALCSLLAMGCARPQASGTGAATSRPASLTPRQTAARLIELHRARRFDELAAWVVPEQADEVRRYLQAVDGFLAANARLCAWVSAEVGPGAVASIDFAALAANLDIFSRYVDLLDEVVEGDAATVTYTVDARLPSRRAAFRRVDGSWRYDPGGGPPGAAAALESMAVGLKTLMADLESGAIDRSELVRDPALLVQEVQRRLRPGVRLLPQPPDGGG